MIYKNAKVYTKHRQFERENINVVDGKVQVNAGGEQVVDGSQLYVIPAMMDVHTHGSMGVTANGGRDDIAKMDGYIAGLGYKGYLPTLVTDDAEHMADVCGQFAEYKKQHSSPSMGLYLEGPFINAAKKGAQNGDYVIEPDVDKLMKMIEAGRGWVKMITVAPEIPGGIDFIKEAAKHCCVALGHTATDYDAAMKAFEAGASCVTHTFNAMNPIGHRAPGLIAAALDSNAYVELICDGIHIHPAVIRMTFKTFPADRIVMISDSVSATGLADGTYTLGGLKTIVADGVSRLEDGTLAGSTTNLHECVRRTVGVGVPMEQVVQAACLNPCEMLGIQNDQVIVVDEQLNRVDG